MPQNLPMPQEKVPTKRKQTGLRLPPILHDELVKAAERNVRTLNAEIVARLSESVDTASNLAKIHAKLIELEKLNRRAIQDK